MQLFSFQLLFAVTFCLAKHEPTEKFFKDLEAFRQELISDIPEFELDLKAEAIVETWSPSNKILWNPVSCKQLGLEFEERELVFGSKQKLDENKVYRVYNGENTYAYKTFSNSHDYTSEVSFYMQASHPNLLRPLCVMRPSSKKGYRAHGGLVMEWFDGFDAMKYSDRLGVSYSDLKKLSKKLMETLLYVHSLGFVHADLKPANVLVSRNGDIKLIDFGFAAPINSVQANRGNQKILAPELAGIGEGKIGFGVDWWAFGSFVAMIHGNQERFLKSTKSGDYSPICICKHGHRYEFGRNPRYSFSRELRQLLHACWHPNPKMRSFYLPDNVRVLKSLAYFSS